MSETAAEAISIDVTTSMVAIVTVITVLVFGLVTLARPSRATITWAAAFALGMLGTYLWVGAHNADQPAVRAAASGLLIGFEPLIWLGLRLHRGARTRWWPVLAFVLVAPALLATTAGAPVFQVVFRVVFLAGGVFAALIVRELLLARQVPRDVTMPLLLASCGFVVIAVAGAASTLIGGGPSPAAQLGLLRGVNAVGTIVTCACAAFTLVLMVRVGAEGVATVAAEEGMRGRLRRARAAQDGSWSLLDIRLDDPADLREAFAGSEYGRIIARFHDDVEEELPAAADVERVADGHVVVLLSGSPEAIQHHLKALLARVSDVHPEDPGHGIRVSASVGWAPSAVCDFDFDELAAAAAAAAAEARAAGGDRWKKVDVALPAGSETPRTQSEALLRATTLEG